MVLRTRMLLSWSGLLLLGTLLATSSATADSTPRTESSSVEQLAIVNHGSLGTPVTVTTRIENAAGDKLDFNGDHFFGPDKEQHDYNRQAHLKLEYVRNQDPQLRRFLGKSIVKRQADFPYPPAVYPPTHYEPPTTLPPTTTTTTTTPAPTTTTTTTEPPPPPPTPGVPHEVYGVPPDDPQDVVVPCGTSSNQSVSPEYDDCVFSQLPPLPGLVYPPPPPPPVPLPTPVDPQPSPVDWNTEPVPEVEVVALDPSQSSLYNINEVVGVFLDGQPEAPQPSNGGPEESSSGSSGCSDCNFEQLPALPELVYPSLPDTTTTPATSPPPPPLTPIVPQEPSSVPSSDCLPAEHRFRLEKERNGNTDLIDLRFSKSSNNQQPRVLSTHSQVILVQSMPPYPVLKSKPGRTPPKAISRGSLKFKHSRKESNFDVKRFEQDHQVWNPNDEDSVVVPSSEQQGEVAQIVLCTVDCHTVEDKVQSPETPAMTIPSDGRLW
uniref:Uncharacterized protein n=1 Tax=Anopheles maculatus TaxID=74869 RepID=A0A182SBU9_9DIPT